MKLKMVSSLLMLAFAGMSFAGDLEKILDKYYEAMGGKEVMAKVKSMSMDGKYVMVSPQGEMEIPFKASIKEGKKMRVDATFQGTTMIQAVDGESGWQVMPMMGTTDPQDMNENDYKSFARMADIHGPLYEYKSKGNKIELIGQEDVEGTQAHKLKITEEDGTVIWMFLDAEYYVPIKSVSTTSNMGMEMEVSSYPSDYKEVGGLMIAHSTSSKTQMGEMVLTFEKVTINPEVSDDHFKKPAAGEGGK